MRHCEFVGRPIRSLSLSYRSESRVFGCALGMGASESNENARSSMETPDLVLGSPPPLPRPIADAFENRGAPSSDAVESLIADLQNLGLNESDTADEADPGNQKDAKKGGRQHRNPSRPGEPDCSFYRRTGTCRFGLNCKFNHPPRWKNKVDNDSDKEVEIENNMENENAKSEKLECKYYLKSGGCKFGKACRYSHPQEKAVEEEELELNFIGLPIRPGERECPYYMRTGSCKFSTNCRFHHPDPTAPGGSDPLSEYNKDISIPLHASAPSQAPAASWSSHGALKDILYTDTSPPYVQMLPLPPQVAHHPSSEWNNYQAPMGSPLLPPERNMQLPSASALSNLAIKTDNSNHQQKLPVNEFPERPGQPDCHYFLRNGDCKFRLACRFNHPKTGFSKSSTPALSPLGLPLRPGQPICIHYKRHGICKSGPSCKFDHPINNSSLDSSASSALPGPS